MSARVKLTASTFAVLVAGTLYWNFHYKNSEYPHPRIAASQTAAQTAATPTANAPAPPTLQPPLQSAAKAVTPPSPHAITDRMADARVIAERIEPTHNNRFTRIRIVEHSSQPFPLRVVDTYELPPPHDVLISQRVMAADHIIVGADTPQTLADMSAYIQTLGDYRIVPTRSPHLLKIQLPAPTLDAVPDAIAALSNLTNAGKYVEPDRLRFPSATPNDPYFDQLHALNLMDATTAWDVTTGSRDVVLAILDTGIDLDHPDLAANLWQNPGEIPDNGIDDDGNGYIDDVNGWDFFANDNSPDDTNGHGTQVAGVAGAVGNNEIGITGVNWQVSLLPLRAGASYLAISEIVVALDYLADLRINRGIPVYVCNNSYGDTGYSPLEYEAIQRQQDAGILFVAAAGNSGNNSDTDPVYPGAYDLDNIINVASTTETDSLASTSNYGATTVDLAAPGTKILTTNIDGGYTTSNGTSFAAPQVAGALALAFANDDALVWTDLRDTLLATVDALPTLANKTLSGGRLNLASLLTPIQLIAITTPQSTTQFNALTNALVFETTVTQDDQTTSPTNPILWSANPSAGVTITTLDDTRAQVSFTQEGAYTVTASLTSAGRARSDTRTILVGPNLIGNVADWRFDGTGTTVADASGNARHGTLEAGAGRTTGVSGTAFDGNGLTHRVSIAGLPSLPVISFAAWVHLDTVGGSDFRLPYVFASAEYFISFDFRGIDDGTNNSLKFGIARGTTLDIWNTPEDSIALGQWYHIAIIHDETNAESPPRIFLNGSEVSVSKTIAIGSTPAGPAYLGNNSSSNRGLDGQLDNVAIFDRLLSEAEITVLASTLTLNAAPALGDLTSDKPTANEAWEPALTVTDADGPDALSYAWEAFDGPATATVDNAQSATPTLTFPTAGNYTLRLRVSDGNATASRQWSITAAAGVYQVSMTSADADLLLLAGTHHAATLAITPVPTDELAISYTTGGTATAGTDYTALVGTLNVPAGEGSASIPITLLTRESGSDATLTLTLASNAAYALGPDSATTLTLKPYTYTNWATHYQLLSGQPADRWTLDADSNANGMSNLLEFSLGFNPLLDDANLRAQRLPAVTRNASGQLVMVYQRPTGSDAARYQVGTSTTPTGQPFAPLPDQGVAIDNHDGTETVTATDTTPLGGDETRFLLLQVSESVPE